MLVRNEVQEEAEGVVIFDEVFQDPPLLEGSQVLLGHVQRPSSGEGVAMRSVLLPHGLFVLARILDTLFEDLHELVTLLGLLVLDAQLLLDLLPFHVLDLLVGDFLFQHLNLVKTSHEVFLEVALDGVSHLFDAVIGMVHFAVVQLVLNVAAQLLIVVLADLRVSRSLAFFVGSFESGLVLERSAVSLIQRSLVVGSSRMRRSG